VLASILAAETIAATFLGAREEGYASRNFNYALGGIKAVVWTDVIQIAVMFGSLAILVLSPAASIE
jgi:hypothetical protein